MDNTRILQRLCWTLLVCMLLPELQFDFAAAQTLELKKPPKVGGVEAKAAEPVQYVLNITRVFILIAFGILAAVGMVVYVAGLIAELNEARERGKWGKFGAFLLIGLLVILIVLFAGFWGYTYLKELTATT